MALIEALVSTLPMLANIKTNPVLKFLSFKKAKCNLWPKPELNARISK